MLILLAMLLCGAARAQDPAVLRRVPAEGPWDVVARLVGRAAAPDGRFVWTTRRRLEVLFQDRSDARQVVRIVSEPGPNDDCYARIERMTAATLVVSCVGEKWSTYESHQFFYDPQRRTLVKHVAYMPFGAVRVRREGIVMGDGEEFLRVSVDAAGVPHVAGAAAGKPGNLGAAWEQARISGMATGHPQILGATEPPAEDDPEAAFGAFRIARQKNRYGSEYTVLAEGAKLYPLPQSDLATWRVARPDDLAAAPGLDWAEMNEEVGPHQWVGGNLWFGKTFYNDEGSSGVGGFGYFDTARRAYKLYAPPEVLRWSVSAILVESDAVWLALYRRGEYGNYPGGLLRWDRQTAHVRQLAMDQIGVAMARIGGVLCMGTIDGLVVMRGDEPASYLVDRSAGGKWEMAARNRSQ